MTKENDDEILESSQNLNDYAEDDDTGGGGGTGGDETATAHQTRQAR